MSDDPTKEIPGDEPLLNKDAERDERVRSESNRLNVLEESILMLSEQIKKLDEKIDARLYDTRPIWEAVQVQLTTLRTDMEKGFRRLDHKIDLYAKNLADVYADQKDMEERVDKLEEKAS